MKPMTPIFYSDNGVTFDETGEYKFDKVNKKFRFNSIILNCNDGNFYMIKSYFTLLKVLLFHKDYILMVER